VVALGIELEMVDCRLHRAFHFGAQRRDDLVVLDGNRPLTFGQPQLLQACFMMRSDWRISGSNRFGKEVGKENAPA
jgi:hypothetical protein